jgi:predicted MFS family arabinose efflux permease
MTTRSKDIALAGCAALAVAMGIGRFAFTPILPLMQAEGTIDVAQGGWLASANYLGYLAGAVTAMGLGIGARGAIRIGLAAVGVTTLLMGLSHHLLAWLALRALAGAASAWVLVFASAWCLERFEAMPAVARAGAGAILFAGVGAGIAVAGVACVFLIMLGVSATGVWIALGALSFAVAALVWNRFDGPGGHAAQAGTPSEWTWNGEAFRLVACYGAFGFGYIVPATFLSAMARDALPDPAAYGWAWPLFGVAAAVSTFAAAAWRRRLSERALWIAGHAAMATGVAIPLVMKGIAGVLVSALLVGGTFMVVTMAGMQEARRVAGARGARKLIAAMTSAFALGQVAGPLAVSFLAARGAGYEGALVAAAIALVASALALTIPFPRTRTT